jgi:hypothetical protein
MELDEEMAAPLADQSAARRGFVEDMTARLLPTPSTAGGGGTLRRLIDRQTGQPPRHSTNRETHSTMSNAVQPKSFHRSHVVYSRAGENQISPLSICNRAERPRHRLARLGPTTSYYLSATPITTVGSELDKKMAPGH